VDSNAASKRVEVAIGIVHDRGRVLICRRKTDQADAFAGLWEFPGGKCEPGETPESCVRRELLEELGIEVTADTPLPEISHDYPSVSVRLHPFVCRLVSGEPRAMSAAEWRWVACADLVTYRFPEANDGLIRSLVDLARAQT
jgi:mutator protein MutT